MPSKSQFEKNFPEEEWNVRKNPLHNRTKKNNKPKSKRPHATRKGSNTPIFNFNQFKGGDGDDAAKAAARRVLGVNSNANSTAIRKAYHKKSKSAHPNKGGSKEEFQRLQAAYAFLMGDRNSFKNEREEEEVRTPPPPEPAPEPKKRGSVLKPKKSADPYEGMTKEEAAAAEAQWRKAASAFEEPPAAAPEKPLPPHMRGAKTSRMAEKVAAGLRAGRFNMGNGKMGSATWNYLHSKRGGATRRNKA
jgi:hypothetical protein